MSGPIRNFKPHGPIGSMTFPAPKKRALPEGKVYIHHDSYRAMERRRRQIARDAARARAKAMNKSTFRCEACLEDFKPSEAHQTTSGQIVCSGCVEFLHTH